MDARGGLVFTSGRPLGRSTSFWRNCVKSVKSKMGMRWNECEPAVYPLGIPIRRLQVSLAQQERF